MWPKWHIIIIVSWRLRCHCQRLSAHEPCLWAYIKTRVALRTVVEPHFNPLVASGIGTSNAHLTSLILTAPPGRLVPGREWYRGVVSPECLHSDWLTEARGHPSVATAYIPQTSSVRWARCKKFSVKSLIRLGVVKHTCNPTTRKAEAPSPEGCLKRKKKKKSFVRNPKLKTCHKTFTVQNSLRGCLELLF
jgi:hypothetical protein